jgi:hypothetical protein
VSDGYKMRKQTSPESEGTMSHNLWCCQFMSTCLILVTDLYPQQLICILNDFGNFDTAEFMQQR